MNSSSTVLFFDLDDTLFDRSHSILAGLEAVKAAQPSLAEFGIERLEYVYRKKVDLKFKHHLGRVAERSDAWSERLRQVFTKLDVPAPSNEELKTLLEIYDAAYKASRQATHTTIQTLEQLKNKGFRLALITNGEHETQAEKAKAIGVSHLFEEIISSEAAGHSKPDEEIFEYALKRMGGANPLKCVMIGNDVVKDMLGGFAANMQIIWYDPRAPEPEIIFLFGSSRPIPVITKMHQIIGYLKNLGYCT
ncbi:HAD-like domain-containing protein [Emericellopsis atlantica]|uniref:HAD-like domain-containing protein n=1 Tax=Emericellopsis atlantica TaxID=2614577 RepID=A0A9P7ZWW7_9HYPO|nr:HAD-like domain-containing protein [Emericellopsis atlantica]KAG9258918.1 HAD-like domain-containing protein [Emericellopsis atlantica]